MQTLDRQLRRQADTAWREEHPPEPLDLLQQQQSTVVAEVADRLGATVRGDERVTAWKKVGCPPGFLMTKLGPHDCWDVPVYQPKKRFAQPSVRA